MFQINHDPIADKLINTARRPHIHGIRGNAASISSQIKPRSKSKPKPKSSALPFPSRVSFAVLYRREAPRLRRRPPRSPCPPAVLAVVTAGPQDALLARRPAGQQSAPAVLPAGRLPRRPCPQKGASAPPLTLAKLFLHISCPSSSPHLLFPSC